MSTKLYYTDFVKAYWMCKEFDVHLLSDSDHDPLDDVMYDVNNPIPKLNTLQEFNNWLGKAPGYKLEVHPESYHIFEPQPGDIVETPDKRFMRCTADPSIFGPGSQSITCQFSSAEYYKRRDGLESKPFNMLTIILRDDKHFFVPQQEETS